jgi:hypothetical protein
LRSLPFFFCLAEYSWHHSLVVQPAIPAAPDPSAMIHHAQCWRAMDWAVTLTHSLTGSHPWSSHPAHGALQGVQSARWWVVYLDSERGLLCRVPLPASLAPDTEVAVASSAIRSSPGTGGGGSSGSTARWGGGHAGPTRSNASPVVVYQVRLAPEREPCPDSWSLIWLFCSMHSVTGT